MWLGLLLVITRMLTTQQWSELWGVIGHTNATSQGKAPAKPGSSPPGIDIPVLTASIGPQGQYPL
jgi:hypothetical protein